MKELHIRNAEIHDASGVLAMQRDLADYCKFPMQEFGVTESRLKAMISAEEANTYVYVAEAAQGLVGFAIANVLATNWRGVRPVYVEDLYARPDFRGYGIGKRLLGRCAELAISVAGGDSYRAQLRLDTDRENNDKTLNFYASLNMTDDEINLRLSGTDLSNLTDNL